MIIGLCRGPLEGSGLDFVSLIFWIFCGDTSRPEGLTCRERGCDRDFSKKKKGCLLFSGWNHGFPGST